MEAIVQDRYTGKTTELIKRSAKSQNYIVCRNPHHVADEARKLDLKIPFPLSYDEWIERKYFGRNITGFLIDDIDAMLNYMSYGTPVNAFTISPKEVH